MKWVYAFHLFSRFVDSVRFRKQFLLYYFLKLIYLNRSYPILSDVKTRYLYGIDDIGPWNYELRKETG